jgi:hypothetical protein
MTSHPLGNVFEVMMEKGQDQIPDEGFLMTKMPMYFIVTVDKILSIGPFTRSKFVIKNNCNDSFVFLICVCVFKHFPILGQC